MSNINDDVAAAQAALDKAIAQGERVPDVGFPPLRLETSPRPPAGDRLPCPRCGGTGGLNDRCAQCMGTGLLVAPASLPLGLSMYHLDTELAQLIEYRADRIADTEDPPAQEEIAALEGVIRQYLEALPKKVAGTAAIFRAWKSQKAAAQAELNRYKGIVARIEANEDLLKKYCVFVLEGQPEPKKGSRKLTGTDGSVLMLKGNGGPAPLIVDGFISEAGVFTDSCPLPFEFRRLTVEMPLSLYTQIEREFEMERYARVIKAEPDNAAIRTALATDCKECNGAGKVLVSRKVAGPLKDCPGCKGRGRWALGGDVFPCQDCDASGKVAEVIDVTTADGPTQACGECDGTGKRKVPGARLGERGSHVEVK